MYLTVLTNRLAQIGRMSNLRCQLARTSATKAKEEEDESTEIPRNLLKDIYSANNQKENGVVYDRKPFKIRLEEGKTYFWCLCGQSKSQPFCNGRHNNIFLKIKQKPIKFAVAKTKDYWLCNCKQTQNRPFCDGSHKKLEVPVYVAKK